jgi:hypothetical protein
MSERRKRGQAEQFKHQRDSAHHDSFKREHLFSKKQEFLTQKFRCDSVFSPTAQGLDMGAAVLLLSRDAMFEVVFNHSVVGRITGDCTSIHDALASDSRASSIINAKICLPPGLSGSFEIQINE